MAGQERRIALKKTDVRPNILWVSFEDTNPFYGCYGDRTANTANLDRLAAEGCRWPHAYSTAGVCAPARAAVITGMYAISIGAHHMRTGHTNEAVPELPTPYSTVVPHYVKCFTEYLRAAGYYCTNNEKTDYQFSSPFTAWDELGPDAHWRNRPRSDQPFFAVFNPTRTHESGMWEGKFDDELTVDPARVKLPPYFPDTPKVRRAMARMYSNIEYNDRILGNLLKQLKDDGLDENTVVFHWSDHGPLPRGKRWPYDSGIHVPMIVRWPGKLKRGSVNWNLVSTVDLAPTVLSIAGVGVPSHMQGRAFLGPAAEPPRKYVHASRDRHDEAYDMVRAVRDRRFKYIRNYHPELPYLPWVPYLNRHPIMQEMWRLHLEGKLKGPQKLMFAPGRPAEELYDCKTDPHEIRNLAGDPAYRRNLVRLRAALDEWLDEVGDMGEIPEAEMVRRWYPAGKQPQTAAPIFVPVCAANPGLVSKRGGRFKSPLLVQLHCATQGASIAYKPGSGGRWLLYSQPLRLEKGRTTLLARASRIGYKQSAESKATFVVG
ncbi:MAG: sulfatase [Verrucomicrobia bacterium]|nr:sulfatase [Verrucomicrobiota bacterium]